MDQKIEVERLSDDDKTKCSKLLKDIIEFINNATYNCVEQNDKIYTIELENKIEYVVKIGKLITKDVYEFKMVDLYIKTSNCVDESFIKITIDNENPDLMIFAPITQIQHYSLIAEIFKDHYIMVNFFRQDLTCLKYIATANGYLNVMIIFPVDANYIPQKKYGFEKFANPYIIKLIQYCKQNNIKFPNKKMTIINQSLNLDWVMDLLSLCTKLEIVEYININSKNFDRIVFKEKILPNIPKTVQKFYCRNGFDSAVVPENNILD